MKKEKQNPEYNNYIKAVSLIKSEREASRSFLQKRLGIGYSEADSIMNNLEQRGLISWDNFTHTNIINEKLFLMNETLLAKTRNYPKFKLPKGYSSNKELLTALVKNNLAKFYPNANEKILERIECELTFLSDYGLDNMFLIVADLVKAMKKYGVTARCLEGKISAHIIAYLLGITGIDPIKYGLIFDTISKTEPPVFCIEEISYVIEGYLKDKYKNIFDSGYIVVASNSPLPDFHVENFRTQAKESGVLIIETSNRYNELARELFEMTKNCEHPNDTEVFDFFASSQKNFFNIPYFQNQSAKDACRKLKPSSLLELACVIALDRPFCFDYIGKLVANKQEPNEILEINSIISEITRETYGIFVFEEQWIEAIHNLTNCDYSTAIELLKTFARKRYDNDSVEIIRKSLRQNPQIGTEHEDIIFNILQKSAPIVFSKAFSLGCAKCAFNIAKMRVALLNS